MMNERVMEQELMKLLEKSNASCEMKDELVYRARRAIIQRDEDQLYGEIRIFKPDDAPDSERNLEIAGADVVQFYMEKYGIKAYVLQHIA